LCTQHKIITFDAAYILNIMNTEILGVTLVDWIGYLAMAVLLVSFMMKNVTKLRVINSVGCVIFILWGVLIHQYPVVITNTSIVLINFYYLFIKKK
jgi:hypothetical protein